MSEDEKPREEKPAEKAEEKAKEKTEKKGKKARTGRKHEKTDTTKFYEVKGSEILRKKKPCPRCGPGTWLAEHKARFYCGRCGYTVFEKKEAKE